jgi:Mrp family chromosome partitioning ATPase
VIFDTAPALILADAALLARSCDAALLVIRAGSTSTAVARKTQERLLQAGTRVIGFVLNRTTTRDSSYYYAYYDNEAKPQKKNSWWGGTGSSGKSRRKQAAISPRPLSTPSTDKIVPS